MICSYMPFPPLSPRPPPPRRGRVLMDHNITHLHPAVSSPSPLAPEPLFPLAASSSSTISCGRTVMCTTFAVSVLNRQSSHRNKHTSSIDEHKTRRKDSKRTFQLRTIIQQPPKEDQPNAARTARSHLPLLPPLPQDQLLE